MRTSTQARSLIRQDGLQVALVYFFRNPLHTCMQTVAYLIMQLSRFSPPRKPPPPAALSPQGEVPEYGTRPRNGSGDAHDASAEADAQRSPSTVPLGEERAGGDSDGALRDATVQEKGSSEPEGNATNLTDADLKKLCMYTHEGLGEALAAVRSNACMCLNSSCVSTC
jgi:hypothetical protein